MKKQPTLTLQIGDIVQRMASGYHMQYGVLKILGPVNSYVTWLPVSSGVEKKITITRKVKTKNIELVYRPENN